MKGRPIILFFLLFCAMVCHTPFISADTGLGLSGNNQHLVIEGFPFHENFKFTVYNTGDRDALFTIKVLGEYSDVVSWIMVEPRMLSLKRGEYREVKCSIDAEEGYGGHYNAKVMVSGYDDVLLEEANISGTSSCILACGSICVSIEVTNKAGEDSRGLVHPPEEANDENGPLFQDVMENLEDSSSGIVLNKAYGPLFLDVPENIMVGEMVALNAGYVGQDDTGDIGVMLISPDGSTHYLEPSGVFSFDVEGIWGIMVLEGETPIIGKSISVEGEKPPCGVLAVLVCCLIVVAVSCMIFHVSRRHPMKKDINPNKGV
ncbi:MAG: hypothetical protein JW825_02960 [Candidatus Methanofastidiosa archaeon]|nr:hypothetical protein [Candidatus Methanofastidiosa archaeon]